MKSKLLAFLITSVWFINGFVCKILNLVSRHQEIVARILNEEHSREITIKIGVLEVFMTIWILSGFKSRVNSITQITVVVIMNIIELILVEDLLLFGKWNIVFALSFCFVVYYNEFVIKKINHV